MMFVDRSDAGKQLVQRFRTLKLRAPIVVGVAKGGVAVGRELARALAAPMDVIVACKVHSPDDQLDIIGAVSEDDTVVLDESARAFVESSPAAVKSMVTRCSEDVRRRVKAYRGNNQPLDVRKRAVVLVDDGMMTGLTASACAQVLRGRGALSVILAVPVASTRAIEKVNPHVDQIISLEIETGAEPSAVRPVSQFYRDFAKYTDEQVGQLFERTLHPNTVDVTIELPKVSGPNGNVQGYLDGELTIPFPLSGMVLFPHGVGTGLASPRTTFIARTLHQSNLGSFRFDLLTRAESAALNESNGQIRPDITLLASRLELVVHWFVGHLERNGYVDTPLGLMAANVGAAAAVQFLATKMDTAHTFSAFVCRGGRPELAQKYLPAIVTPTLFVVGGEDQEILANSRNALEVMNCPAHLEIVPGADRLFQQPGALEAVAHLAVDWYQRCFDIVRSPLHDIRQMRHEAS